MFAFIFSDRAVRNPQVAHSVMMSVEFYQIFLQHLKKQNTQHPLQKEEKSESLRSATAGPPWDSWNAGMQIFWPICTMQTQNTHTCTLMQPCSCSTCANDPHRDNWAAISKIRPFVRLSGTNICLSEILLIV